MAVAGGNAPFKPHTRSHLKRRRIGSKRTTSQAREHAFWGGWRGSMALITLRGCAASSILLGVECGEEEVWQRGFTWRRQGEEQWQRHRRQFDCLILLNAIVVGGGMATSKTQRPTPSRQQQSCQWTKQSTNNRCKGMRWWAMTTGRRGTRWWQWRGVKDNGQNDNHCCYRHWRR